MIFLLGVAGLLPIGMGLAAGGEPEAASVAGLWGSFIAFYLKRLVGSWGSWILLVALFSALMAWTLRWNPIRAIVGPSPARNKASSGSSLAQEMEPPPEDMPAISVIEDEAQDTLVPPAERKRARRPAATEAEASVESPGSYGSEDELPPTELITPAPAREGDDHWRIHESRQVRQQGGAGVPAAGLRGAADQPPRR